VEYRPREDAGNFLYSLATPLYGLTFGLSILFIASARCCSEKVYPEEITIQDRHDGASREIDRKTVVANLTDALDASTIKRRKLVGRPWAWGWAPSARHPRRVAGDGQDPWKPVVPTADGKKAVLWTSAGPRATRETSIWRGPPGLHSERRSSSCARKTSRRRDGDRLPLAGVRRRRHHRGVTRKAGDDRDGHPHPVMLIRIKPTDVGRVVKRQGQESFNFGEF